MAKHFMRTFKHKGGEFLVSECLETVKIYTGEYLTYAELNSEILKNGNVAHLSLKLYINGATTEEQDKLTEFVKENKYLNLNSLYINKFGYVYKLWGHVTYDTDRPFILMNVNNVADQILVDDIFVRKFFNKNSNIDNGFDPKTFLKK